MTLIEQFLTRPFVIRIARDLAIAATGAISAYLIDRGLLDGDAADQLANALIQIAVALARTTLGG